MAANARFVLFYVLFCTFLSYVSSVSDFEQLQSYTRDEALVYYFQKGFTHSEIAALLLSVHGLVLSVRQIRSILRSFNLIRQKPATEQDYINAIVTVQEELKQSGQCLGYCAV